MTRHIQEPEIIVRSTPSPLEEFYVNNPDWVAEFWREYEAEKERLSSAPKKRPKGNK